MGRVNSHGPVNMKWTGEQSTELTIGKWTDNIRLTFALSAALSNIAMSAALSAPMSAPMSSLAMVLRRAKSVINSVTVKLQSTGWQQVSSVEPSIEQQSVKAVQKVPPRNR